MDEIARNAGYARTYISSLKKAGTKGDRGAVIKALQEAYPEIIQHVSLDQKSIENQKAFKASQFKFTRLGFNKEGNLLDDHQRDTLLLTIAQQVAGVLGYSLRAVSALEDVPIEELIELEEPESSERLRSIEDAMYAMSLVKK